MDNPEVFQNLRHNFLVNLMDGAFFGAALGFASFVTIIPLFVSDMTNSPILIGLIPAIHSVGWQFPQLLTVRSVTRQKKFLPMVLWRTIHERIPFLGLAVIAWMMPRIGTQAALWLTFLMLIWQGLGGGITATAWQSMIAKIIPSDRRGTFFGGQSAAANLLASLTAVLAGIILSRFDSPLDYTLCFGLASVGMVVSWFSLASTRESEQQPQITPAHDQDFWSNLGKILRRDTNFRWFLAARMLSQFAIMGFAFYTVYAVQSLGMSDVQVGIMTGVYLGAQIVINPVMGWIGDRWSHRSLMAIGLFSGGLSALLAWMAPHPVWFYMVWILAGVANVGIWTIGLTMILEFGSDVERPSYIGLSNSLVAPATILVPFVGGWLAEWGGYPTAFIASIFGAFASVIVLHFFVRDPRQRRPLGLSAVSPTDQTLD